MGHSRTKILFIHQNFPGQFRHIAAQLAIEAEYEVLAIGKHGCASIPGVRTLRYKLHRVSAPGIHSFAKPFEKAVLHGQAVLRELQRLREAGYQPDVIIAHPGWGETMFVRDAFPSVRLIHFAEYFYRPHGADLGFDPEFPPADTDAPRVLALNALHLLNLDNCDIAVAPTEWQKGLHPAVYLDKIEVLHEGVDTTILHPDSGASFVLPSSGKTLRAGDDVVTFVARNLEPYRGFHSFLRALPKVLAVNPRCEILIVGGTEAGYGNIPKDAPDWKTKLLREVDLDLSRVHFLGRIPYSDYVKVLQVSAAHVYLTYPFVLSWSMLEAMACGCLVIGSDTPPVREVITHGRNGLLVDFFDAQAIAQSALMALDRKAENLPLRMEAARHVRANYSTTLGLAGYKQLLWKMCRRSANRGASISTLQRWQ